ncbi:MAG TPA: T9SS type A sorting domain-containing protein [Bacteroidia bacterium]|nr:T9SS type A sorting domain-containing protein [Bacteroidia bacterium]
MKKIYTIILLTLSVTLAKATVHTVSVLASSFSPSTVNAVCGDTVAWVLVSGTHTTTSTTIPSCGTPWDAPINSSTPGFAIVVPCAGTFNYVCTPHGFTGVINATCSTGISDVAADDNSPAVSPNPSADGIFNLMFNGKGNMPNKIYVLNVDGRKILDENIASGATNHTINLQSHTSGIYFLVMENEKGRRVMKVVR